MTSPFSRTPQFKNSPIQGRPSGLIVTSEFSTARVHPITKKIRSHFALDIDARSGEPLVAVWPGIVRTVVGPQGECGNGIVMEHDIDGQTYRVSYCHMSQPTSLSVGASIKAGDIVGRVGSTGTFSTGERTSTGPHLHIAVKRVVNNQEEPLNPRVFMVGMIGNSTTSIGGGGILGGFTGVTSLNTPVEYSPLPRNPVAITPFIHTRESFHPKIQYELTRRRVSAETANVYMPFVKLTSLTKVLDKDNLPTGVPEAYCPSLGIHGQDEVSFDDIYSPRGDKSKIGYATTIKDGIPAYCEVLVKNNSRDAYNIPMPGITQLTAERGTAGPMGVRGGLLKADLKIVAYSVGQVDALLRYFLRPATRVVLELGRLSSNTKEKNNENKPVELDVYNWKQDVTIISEYFSKLITSPTEQQKFISKYMYDNFGNYEIFIAYVVKFNLKYNKNNTYEIDLTLHSVQQFEVPTKHTSVAATCADATKKCAVIDVQEYFNDMSSWKTNSFTQLMSSHINDSEWGSQIIPIRNTNTNQVGAGSTQGGTRENEYYVTWRFFVEKILGDPTLGFASLLADADKVISQLALLQPTDEPSGSAKTGLVANQVGYHPDLRSVNPGVMIIYNEKAQTRYENSPDKSTYQSIVRTVEVPVTQPNGTQTTINISANNSLLDKFKLPFTPPFTNIVYGDNSKPGASYLTRGIWLNTGAIKQAFKSADTITSGLNNLLTMMNTATEGYWNLQLYSTDVENPGYHIVDMGLSKTPKLKVTDVNSRNSDTKFFSDLFVDGRSGDLTLKNLSNNINSRWFGTEDDPIYIYVFNRETKISPGRDGEIGSDIIDLNVEFNLPQVIAVQAIANIGGPAQKSTLQSINVKELQDITLIKDIFKDCNDPANICTDQTVCLNADNIKNLADEVNKIQVQVDETVNQLNLFVSSGAAASLPETDRNRIISEDQRSIDGLLGQLRVAQDNLKRAQDEVNVRQNPNLVNTVREYADLGTALELVEINPSRMLRLLNLDSTQDISNRKTESPPHAFNSSNLTKTIAEVTLPGIGGINLFQAFLVDRVPSILERGYYVVTKITHEFTIQNGWITKIQGRFRFNPKGIPENEDTGPAAPTC